MGIPLSVTGLGKLTALLTASLVASTAVASAFLFKESFSLRAILGIVLAVVAIALIGEPS
jgi:multidrug transporter EmrE-like cation transporter